MTEFIKPAKWAADITGLRSGRLTALGPISRAKGGVIIWLCRCDCGNTTNVHGHDFRAGKTQSCGCLVKERLSKRNRRHGLTGTPVWRTWSSMISRCSDQGHRQFAEYGGRGIKVCERWTSGERGVPGFECFLADMGNRPNLDYSLDRIDNNKGYEPSNCRWATRFQQQNNRRTTKFLEFRGQRKPLTDWAREIGISSDVIRDRLRSGFSIERALTRPYGRKKILTYKGLSLTTEEWASRTGINSFTIRKRLLSGWSVERALAEPTHTEKHQTSRRAA